MATREQLRHPVSGETYAALRERARAMRSDGCTMPTIEAALGVSKPTAWKWVRDLPCHGDVARANHSAASDRKRVYPRGTRAYAQKLLKAGVPPEERIQLTRELAR